MKPINFLKNSILSLSLSFLFVNCSSENKADNIQNPSTFPSSGLVAWYPFNGNANDSSPNNNNGIINGASLTTDRFGNQNKAYLFNGVNNHISIINSSSLSSLTSITIAGWFYTNNFTSDQGLVTKWFQKVNCSNNTDAYTCILSKNSFINNLPSFVGATSLYTGYQLKTSTNIQTNTWTHFVFIHENLNGGKLFINGSLVATYPNIGTICNSTNQVLIGADNNLGTINRFFNGKLDDIGIWNRALTNQEIQQLYTSTN